MGYLYINAVSLASCLFFQLPFAIRAAFFLQLTNARIKLENFLADLGGGGEEREDGGRGGEGEEKQEEERVGG